MTKRRSRGDGGLYWDEKRQRWIADHHRRLRRQGEANHP